MLKILANGDNFVNLFDYFGIFRDICVDNGQDLIKLSDFIFSGVEEIKGRTF
jgi:hypothetical protein